MILSTSTVILFCFANQLPTANAQVTYNWPQRSWGRVIAGAIVGGVAGLFLLCILLRLIQRRRVMRANPGAQPNFFYGKPMFGGPWGRSNGTAIPPPPVGQVNSGGPSYNRGNSFGNTGPVYNRGSSFNAPYSSTPPAITEYPAPNAPLPPPAYGQDANYEGQYAPPSGAPPPVNSVNHANYAPPVSPPAAHTTGQDNTFVGGFRS
ncbi:hypothetical protein JR316_0007607 [Psilocybe cubensis]|uniref:Uncharacterized protein n=2 Tax=Psilocybe cubensis TaxID=181762 RepID=A0A8H7XV44_PSICU|nr:hypothetical protein JR316_0007607 [Psilocybe cubensis]KAH9479033.1 hypothetical protein JR316_0007607 [Psilocybe cubensis]